MSLAELTAELSALTLTGPLAMKAVLFNRDLFLHVARFCELPQLAALSATCKALEESVLDRQTWWHQCERLWPWPSLRSSRDPRGLCRRLKVGDSADTCKLQGLDDLVLLVQIVKPDEEALHFEFNIDKLAMTRSQGEDFDNERDVPWPLVTVSRILHVEYWPDSVERSPSGEIPRARPLRWEDSEASFSAGLDARSAAAEPRHEEALALQQAAMAARGERF